MCRDLEEFQRAVIADRRGRNKQNVYTVPLRTQVIALTKRTILLKLQDRTGCASSIFRARLTPQ